MKKKVKKLLKKELKDPVLFFAVLFVIVGLVLGYIISNLTNKEGFTKIELVGDSVINLNIGEDYVEQGYTFVVDDTDYTNEVIVDGSVNTNKEGTYILTYELVSNGHEIILTRIINVLGGASDGE